MTHPTTPGPSLAAVRTDGSVAGVGCHQGAIRCTWWVAGLIHLLFWVSLRTDWISPLFYDTQHCFGPGCDLFALYAAGNAALHHSSLYAQVVQDPSIPYGYPFRYLPLTAYFPGILLTLVSPPTAYALWLAFNEVLVLYNVRLTQRRFGNGIRGVAAAALWLVFAPLYVHMWLGQFTLLLASLIFWSVLNVEMRRGQLGQWFWILSVLWKPASFLWLPIWLRDRRYWWGCAVLLAVLAANGLYFWHFPADYRVFWNMNMEPAPTWSGANIGLSALLRAVVGFGDGYRIVRYAADAVLVLPALWLTLRTWNPQTRRDDDADAVTAKEFWLHAALWTVLFFLVYKDVWEQHLLLLLPFFCFLIARSRSRLALALVAILSLPAPVIFYDVPNVGVKVDVQPLLSTAGSWIQHTWRVVPLLILYGYLLAQIHRKAESGAAKCSPGNR